MNEAMVHTGGAVGEEMWSCLMCGARWVHYIAVVVYTQKKCKVRKARVGKVPGSGEGNQKLFLDQRKRAGKPTMKSNGRAWGWACPCAAGAAASPATTAHRAPGRTPTPGHTRSNNPRYNLTLYRISYVRHMCDTIHSATKTARARHGQRSAREAVGLKSAAP